MNARTTRSTLNPAPTSTEAATETDGAEASAHSVPEVDTSHPAVDADPRANTTDEQNSIDFNDPAASGQAAVERALKGE